MRRFKHPSGKYWMIDDADGAVRVRWGKIGTAGSNRVAPPGSSVDALIAKQLAEGYVEWSEIDALAAAMNAPVRWFQRFEGGGKFVALALHGTKLEEWRGELGEAGELRTHDKDSSDNAKELAIELVANAFVGGLAPVEGGDVVEAAPLALAGNPALEAMCRAAPDDPGPWGVYADWLMTHQDPRGELAALRASGKTAEADARWAEVKEAMLTAGPTTDDDELAAYDTAGAIEITTWRHGFAAAATVAIDHDTSTGLAEVTQRFLASPLATFVDELRFGLSGFESNNNWGPTLAAVTSSPHAAHIRSLRFDAYTYEQQEISWTAFGDFSQAWPKLARLEELRIRSGRGGTLGEIDLPELRTFVRVSGGLSASEIASITSAVWPKLEHLEIWFGRRSYDAEGDVEMLKPVFDGKELPALRHLGIVNCEFSADAIIALVASRILPRLTTLDLSQGVIARAELALLVTHADAFRHLAAIDVSRNFLTPAQLAELAKVLPNATGAKQRELDYDEDEEEDEDFEDSRYAALGE